MTSSTKAFERIARVAGALALVAGCASSGPGTSGETHFLVCKETSECRAVREDYDCIEGHCRPATLLFDGGGGRPAAGIGGSAQDGSPVSNEGGTPASTGGVSSATGGDGAEVSKVSGEAGGALNPDLFDSGGISERDASVGDGGEDAAIEGGSEGGESRTPVDGTGILGFAFPPRHSLTDAAGIRVSGIVKVGAGITGITVNGVPVDNLEGTFAKWRTSSDVPLAPGRNVVSILAQRRNAAPLTLSANVWRAPYSASGDPTLAPVPFGSGVALDGLFRAEPLEGAVLRDGSLVVQDSASGPPQVVLHPDTGARTAITLPASGSFCSNPETGGVFVGGDAGFYSVDATLSKATRIAASIGFTFACDATQHMAYGFYASQTGLTAVDTSTGQEHTIAADPSSAFSASLGQGIYGPSVSPDHGTVYFAAFPNVPGAGNPYGIGCFAFDLATGSVTPFFEIAPCPNAVALDGRLLAVRSEYDGSFAPDAGTSSAASIGVVDPLTGHSSAFSRAPDRGRGYPLVGSDNVALVVDPFLDRWWVVTAPINGEPPGGRYFAIDPMNGDRVLVSD